MSLNPPLTTPKRYVSYEFIKLVETRLFDAVSPELDVAIIPLLLGIACGNAITYCPTLDLVSLEAVKAMVP